MNENKGETIRQTDSSEPLLLNYYWVEILSNNSYSVLGGIRDNFECFTGELETMKI